MSEEKSEKKPGLGSVIEPVALIILTALVGMCAGGFVGGRIGRSSFEDAFKNRDPASEGRKRAWSATEKTDKRLQKAFQKGLEKGKEAKLKEIEADLKKLKEEDKNIWNTTIEENAINSCTSYYMKGINDGEKAYESAFRWEYQVPKCSEGMIKTELSERIQLYHGKIPVGNPYEREISEELLGDCHEMSKHYVDVLKKINKFNRDQKLNWEVEKKEVRISGE